MPDPTSEAKLLKIKKKRQLFRSAFEVFDGLCLLRRKQLTQERYKVNAEGPVSNLFRLDGRRFLL
jgi:hypothetical protein